MLIILLQLIFYKIIYEDLINLTFLKEYLSKMSLKKIF